MSMLPTCTRALLLAALLVFTTATAAAAQSQAQDGTGASSEAPHPSDSLDGRDIVFASERVGSDIEIWRMSADGSDPRRLTHNEGVRDNFPAWSPDRRRIAFLSNRDTSRQGTGIYVMGADGSDVRAVGPRNWPLMLFPEWSPDGRELLFSAGSSLLDLDLYLMEADGSNLRQLTSGPAVERCASWGPEGNRVLYTSDRGDTTRLMVLDRASGDTKAVLPDGMEGMCAYWSPDGDRIAFASEPDLQLPPWESTVELLREPTDHPFVLETFVIDLRARTVTQLTDVGAVSNYPRWSADGRRLLFQSTRAFDGSFMEEGQIHYEWFDVYTMNPDGSDVQRLTDNQLFDAHPNW